MEPTRGKVDAKSIAEIFKDDLNANEEGLNGIQNPGGNNLGLGQQPLPVPLLVQSELGQGQANAGALVSQLTEALNERNQAIIQRDQALTERDQALSLVEQDVGLMDRVLKLAKAEKKDE